MLFHSNARGQQFWFFIVHQICKTSALKKPQREVLGAVHPKVHADISSPHSTSKPISKSQSLFHCLVHWEFIPSIFVSFTVPADLSLSRAALLKHFSASMSEGTTEGGNSQLTRFHFLSSLSCEQNYIYNFRLRAAYLPSNTMISHHQSPTEHC